MPESRAALPVSWLGNFRGQAALRAFFVPASSRCGPSSDANRRRLTLDLGSWCTCLSLRLTVRRQRDGRDHRHQQHAQMAISNGYT